MYISLQLYKHNSLLAHSQPQSLLKWTLLLLLSNQSVFLQSIRRKIFDPKGLLLCNSIEEKTGGREENEARMKEEWEFIVCMYLGLVPVKQNRENNG